MAFASVIIPVHKRRSTLPFALRSLQQQSIGEIEIVLAGDGCTPQVKAICQHFANADSRITFHDFPKAPLRGVVNRDRAVRQAKADRIFYCDDDDLFLPNHIEILGKNLEAADIIDTPPITACPEGHIELGIHDSGHKIQKKLLLDERFKGVFDTHLAHTKEAYLANSGAWLNADDPRVVLHMLKAFARNPKLIWKTIDEITALSLHGARRAGMTTDQRESEIRQWAEKIGRSNFTSEVRKEGRYVHHLIRLIWAVGTLPPSDQTSFLEHLGFHQCRQTGRIAIGAALHQKFSQIQRDRIDALFSFTSLSKHDWQKMGLLIAALLNPLLGPGFPSEHIIGLLANIYDYSEIKKILQQVENGPGRFLSFLELELLNKKDIQPFLESIRSGEIEVPTFDKFFFYLNIAQLLLRSNSNHQCHRWCDSMLGFQTKTRYDLPYWELRRELAAKLNLPEELKWVQQQITWFKGKT